MVLLIEQDPKLAEAYRTILIHHGYDVELVSGQDAIPAARDWQAVIIGEAEIEAGKLEGLRTLYISDMIRQFMSDKKDNIFSINHCKQVVINYHEPPDTHD